MTKKPDETAAALQPEPFQTAEAFPGLVIAGELDDLNGLPKEVTMTEDWMLYMNAWVMSELGATYEPRPAWLRFLPDPATKDVIVLPAKDGNEYGAQEVRYVETENGATVNVRLALKKLQVPRLPDRVRIFPVITRKGNDGKMYVAFSVKDGSTRPVQKRKPADGAQSANKGDQKPGTTPDAK